MTQISPVVNGYTSQSSSNHFKVTGKRVDEYLMKLLYQKFSLDLEPKALQMDTLSLFKIKNDLKETFFSPYKIPFNYEMLAERQKLDPSNKNAYRQYLLPDQKTMVCINVGDTDIEITNDLVGLYYNSSQINWNVCNNYHGGNESIPDYRYGKGFVDERKSLIFKIMSTIN